MRPSRHNIAVKFVLYFGTIRDIFLPDFVALTGTQIALFFPQVVEYDLPARGVRAVLSATRTYTGRARCAGRPEP